MINFKKLKKLKNISVIFVPESTSREPKSYKLSFRKLLLILSVYSLIIFLMGFYIISFTPLSEVLFPYSLRLTDSDKKKIEILDNKVIILAKEIESLKSLNKKLKFAIMLGDSTLINKDELKADTLNNDSPYQGNILVAFSKLFENLFNQQEPGITFIKPAEGYISQKFLPDRGHYGVDFVMNENRPIFASASGYVVFASYTTDYGYTLIINHSGNYVTKYMHCSSLLKKEGDSVVQGELIALSGNSGTESSGPHLHFEIWKDGKPIDPLTVLTNN
jgi:murein DD-endopeptidase MepM/ murein hydrolase activator NlpD